MSLADFLSVSAIMLLLGGIIGFVFGSINQRQFYKKWFKTHCYFCGVFIHATEDATPVDFAGSLEVKAHVTCWELNHFTNEEWPGNQY